jgi:hypothetical protein
MILAILLLLHPGAVGVAAVCADLRPAAGSPAAAARDEMACCNDSASGLLDCQSACAIASPAVLPSTSNPLAAREIPPFCSEERHIESRWMEFDPPPPRRASA